MTGSSPHVRGTLNPYRCPNIRMGIIPACAGNTKPCTATGNTTRDHPRMCGEHVGFRPGM